jgi:hypothetical protein
MANIEKVPGFLALGEEISVKSVNMVVAAPRKPNGTTFSEIVAKSECGRDCGLDLLAMITQRLARRGPNGYTPTDLGIALAYSFTEAGFDLTNGDLLRFVNAGMREIEEGDESAKGRVLAVMNLVLGKLVEKVEEIQEIFGAVYGKAPK